MQRHHIRVLYDDEVDAETFEEAKAIALDRFATDVLRVIDGDLEEVVRAVLLEREPIPNEDEEAPA